ncbi:hypothetical protein C8A00DRAFT_38422 [Chaetomidium leptoderma]|uniref:Uncharacterized protein n=1 Tax=Chaetomidium leptoderma TaxID=669021 RepID=A0AAN6VCT4_9PEZI|nr:hypothetical protein C8A00DRAFT_38422 [Chaetomidium leptoderma]
MLVILDPAIEAVSVVLLPVIKIIVVAFLFFSIPPLSILGACTTLFTGGFLTCRTIYLYTEAGLRIVWDFFFPRWTYPRTEIVDYRMQRNPHEDYTGWMAPEVNSVPVLTPESSVASDTSPGPSPNTTSPNGFRSPLLPSYTDRQYHPRLGRQSWTTAAAAAAHRGHRRRAHSHPEPTIDEVDEVDEVIDYDGYLSPACWESLGVGYLSPPRRESLGVGPPATKTKRLSGSQPRPWPRKPVPLYLNPQVDRILIEERGELKNEARPSTATASRAPGTNKRRISLSPLRRVASISDRENNKAPPPPPTTTTALTAAAAADRVPSKRKSSLLPASSVASIFDRKNSKAPRPTPIVTTFATIAADPVPCAPQRSGSVPPFGRPDSIFGRENDKMPRPPAPEVKGVWDDDEWDWISAPSPSGPFD